MVHHVITFCSLKQISALKITRHFIIAIRCFATNNTNININTLMLVRILLMNTSGSTLIRVHVNWRDAVSQDEIKSIDWDGIVLNMTSAVGKKDSRLLSLICPEKQVNWNEIITCDLQTIKDFIDIVEACYLGYKFVQNNLVSNFFASIN